MMVEVSFFVGLYIHIEYILAESKLKCICKNVWSFKLGEKIKTKVFCIMEEQEIKQLVSAMDDNQILL